ncbi:MAG TPA: hypothetical protein VJ302_05965, partial [Blastocatellia bacterium]|nr:hypothetical protein [Blastocatellia bacterium]
MERRIEVILEIEHRRHLLAAAVICASAVWAAAGGPFADLASAAAVQEKRPDGAVPVQYENNPQLPAA